MSRVFLATETALDRRVVIKLLPPELSHAVSIDRFRQEIRFAARLQHPHIVPLPPERPDATVIALPVEGGVTMALRHRQACGHIVNAAPPPSAPVGSSHPPRSGAMVHHMSARGR